MRYFYQKRAHSLGWQLMTDYVEQPEIQTLLKRAKEPGAKTLKEKLQLNLQKIWLGARTAAEQELLAHPQYGRKLNQYIDFLASEKTKELDQELKGIEE